jgi:Tfp pilus assembly protein PilX
MIISRRRQQRGATTLVIATMLLVTATLIVLFAGSYSLMQQKITANQYRNQQAYMAAEAGLEFGINYLQVNTSPPTLRWRIMLNLALYIAIRLPIIII